MATFGSLGVVVGGDGYVVVVADGIYIDAVAVQLTDIADFVAVDIDAADEPPGIAEVTSFGCPVH